MQFMEIAMLNLKKTWPAASSKACFACKIFAVAKIFVNSAPRHMNPIHKKEPETVFS